MQHDRVAGYGQQLDVPDLEILFAAELFEILPDLLQDLTVDFIGMALLRRLQAGENVAAEDALAVAAADSGKQFPGFQIDQLADYRGGADVTGHRVSALAPRRRIDQTVTLFGEGKAHLGNDPDHHPVLCRGGAGQAVALKGVAAHIDRAFLARAFPSAGRRDAPDTGALQSLENGLALRKGHLVLHGAFIDRYHHIARPLSVFCQEKFLLIL